MSILELAVLIGFAAFAISSIVHRTSMGKPLSIWASSETNYLKRMLACESCLITNAALILSAVVLPLGLGILNPFVFAVTALSSVGLGILVSELTSREEIIGEPIHVYLHSPEPKESDAPRDE
jgi:hypothetical protein